jgi:thiamine biosynthesis protein ThiS
LAITSNPLGKITVQLNGKTKTIPETTIEALLVEHKLNPNMVIVELNGTIIDKKDHTTTLLGEKDTIEIIRYIGGGEIVKLPQ